MRVPPIKDGRNWFTDAAPDDGWTEIRERLTISNNPISKKRSFRHVDLDSYSLKRKKARAALEKADKDSEQENALRNNLVIVEAVQEVQKRPSSSIERFLVESDVAAMRKSFTTLSHRRQLGLTKTLRSVVDTIWPIIAPGQDNLQKESWIGATYSFIDDGIRSNVRKVYDCAVKLKDEDQKTRVLSMFVLQDSMTRAKLSAIVGHAVTGNKCLSARHHATLYGAGMEAEKIVRKRNCDKEKEVVNKFVAYLIRNGLLTANGRTIKQDGEDDVSEPNIKRLEGKQPLLKGFEEGEKRQIVARNATTVASKRLYISLRRKDMETIISVVCPEAHSSMEALDVVTQQHGVLNFKRLQIKLSQLGLIAERMNNDISEIKRAIIEVDEILSSKLKFRSQQHFLGPRNNKGPACHCHYFAFGKVDPVESLPDSDADVLHSCGHYHNGSCATCDSIVKFDHLFVDLINQIDSLTGDEAEKATQLDFQYHLDRFRHYSGHQARLAHESESPCHLKDRMMKDETLLSVTADYAMKYLPRKDSEAQTEFFGKSGINWHGLCIMWYCPKNDQFMQYFVNQCVEDSTEDGISIVTLLSQVR